MSGRRMDTRRQHRDEVKNCTSRNQTDNACGIRTIYFIGQPFRTAGLGAVVVDDAGSDVDGKPGVAVRMGYVRVLLKQAQHKEDTMENLKKVELIAQHLEARASGWTSSEQNLDALLAAVQAIELKEAGDEIKRIADGLRLPGVKMPDNMVQLWKSKLAEAKVQE